MSKTEPYPFAPNILDAKMRTLELELGHRVVMIERDPLILLSWTLCVEDVGGVHVHVDVEDEAVDDVDADDVHEDVVHAGGDADVDVEIVDGLDGLKVRLVDDDMFFWMGYDACSLGMVSRRLL